MSKENLIVAYKGFDNDFKCRGFQYEVGNTYEHTGDVVACASGFHSCTNPWDVFSYYDVTQRFAKVTLGGKTSTHEDDSKIASAKITIDYELTLPEYIKTCINYLADSCGKEKGKQAASGNYRQLAASGNYSQLAASGYSSKLAASGDYSQLAASGYSSKLAASGDYSKLAASGYSSKLAASGDYSKLAASGDYSVACNAGNQGKVKGGKNCAMSLAYWVESESRYRIAVAYVGENGIKADTWYELDNEGSFVECQND